MQQLLQWRKTSNPVKQGKLVHYTPDNSGCYVYARIDGNQTVLVVLNGKDTEQTITTARFKDVLGNSRAGKDILTGKTLPLEESITIAPRDVYIMELL